MKYDSYYLPGPIYQALPFIYILFGMLVIIHLETYASWLSGFLLFAAGMLVLGWRLSARSDRRKHARRRARAIAGRVPGGDGIRWE